MSPPLRQRRVEATLELLLPLRLQVGVARASADERARVPADRARRIRREQRPERRPVPGLAVGAAELELVHAAERVLEQVRCRELRVEEVLAGTAVGAAPVGPEAGGEQQPAVGQEHLFLTEEPEVTHRLEPGEHGLARGLLRTRLPRQERPPEDLGRE